MPKRKYTHGENIGSSIRLYYQSGLRRKFIEIPPHKAPWYFYVRKMDYIENKSTFVALRNRKDIIKVEQHNDKFVKVYAVNKNIPVWKVERGEDDPSLRARATLERIGVKVYESDLSSLDRFCIDNEVEVEDDYYIGYFDIETDDRVGTFEPGAGRILSCAIVDNFGKTWYFTHKNEYLLLKKIVATLRQFAIIVGYNSEAFDLPYIKVRCQIKGITFPTHDMIHIDMWDRIKTIYMFDKEGPPSYSLDIVSRHFLKKGKAVFDNDNGFYWNWKNNHEQFKQYNIQDTRLLLELDEKLEIIPTMVLQCKLCGIFLNKFWNTRLTDMYLLRLAKQEGMCLPTKKLHYKVPMPGGHVSAVKPGIYERVYVWDFSQMYSTIMRSFNVSPETLRVFSSAQMMGLNARERDEYTVSAVDMAVRVYLTLVMQWVKMKKMHIFPHSTWYHFKVRCLTSSAYHEMRAWIKKKIEGRLTIKFLETLEYFIKVDKEIFGVEGNEQSYDVIFRYNRQPRFIKGEKSLVFKMLQTYVAKRDEAKGKMKKHEEKTPKWKLWNQYNLAYKLMGNIVFGYLSSHKNRCYSHAIACSITLAGQMIKGMVAKGAYEKFGAVAVYGDTDSVFFQVAVDPANLAAFDKKFFKWFKPFISGMLKKYFNIDEHCMGIEPKGFYDVLLLIKKKNYVGWIAAEKRYDEVGVAFVKRSTIPYGARLQKKLIKDLIHKPEFRGTGGLVKWAMKERDKFLALEITPENLKDLVVHIRVKKNPDEYDTNPIHVRIVRRMLANKQQFFIGDVLSYVIVKSDEKTQQGEEINNFLKDGTFEIDKIQYWNKIFKILKQVFDALDPEANWNIIDPKLNALRKERIATRKKAFIGAAGRIKRAHARLEKAKAKSAETEEDRKKRSAKISKARATFTKARDAMQCAVDCVNNLKCLHQEDRESIFEWAKEEGFLPTMGQDSDGEDQGGTDSPCDQP